MGVRMQNTNDVRKILFLKAGVVQTHPARIRTRLCGFLSGFHDGNAKFEDADCDAAR
jgi:hypothetical protein